MKVCMVFWLRGLFIFRFFSRLELLSLLLPRVTPWLLPRVTLVVTTVEAFQAWKVASLKGFN